MHRGLKIFALVIATALVLAPAAFAKTFKIGIMQDSPKEGATFKPVLDYLKKSGIDAEFVTAPNYPAAAQMFAKGEVDAMFSGSGVAGAMILKGVAFPAVRPVFSDDSSTYWAVVLAPKGAKKFVPDAAYFKGKKVVYCGLASAGEIFLRSIPGAAEAASQLIPAPNHQEAINILSKGLADVALVKNRVWNKVASQFPGVEMVGEDDGENPDRVLIVSRTTPRKTVDRVTEIMLGVRSDKSPEAAAIKSSLSVRGFIRASAEDFAHTLSLLRKAGVTPSFDFKF